MSRDFEELGIWDKIEAAIRLGMPNINNYRKNGLNINAASFLRNLYYECEREQMVSYAQMLPILKHNVPLKKADYILFMHPYARIEDRTEDCVKCLKNIDKNRKEDAEIIVMGKACNAKPYLEGIKNISYYPSNFVKKIGEKFNFDIEDKYILYDNVRNSLNIWPVDGCLQKCKFCRRTYMDIPFESQPLEFLKEKLDLFKENHPEQMKHVFLRAENLCEYGIDIYGKQELDKVIDLIDSYDEVETISFIIGLSIGEMNDKILESLCRSKKIARMGLNLEAGSNRLLKLINKPHTREKAIYVYKQLREAHPNLFINCTMMIGLPTEEFEDIIELADLVEQTQPDKIMCNYYGHCEKNGLNDYSQMSDSLKQYHLKYFYQLLGQKNFDRDIEIKGHAILDKKKRKDIKKIEKVEDRQKKEMFGVYQYQKVLFKKNK